LGADTGIDVLVISSTVYNDIPSELDASVTFCHMLHTLRHATLVFKPESINPLWITVFHANGIAIGIDGSLNPTAASRWAI
jgi:hypothetical protein